MSEEKNPWTTLRSSRRYENKWIAVDEHEVRDAAGNTSPYGVVRFKRRGHGILPIDSEGCTYLVGQYRYAAGRYSWELPAGGGRLEEDPLEAAQRELREETGITAEHWLELLHLTISGAITDERAVCYVAWGLDRQKRELDEQEVVKVRRVRFAEVMSMVLKGEINSAVSVATVLAVHARASCGDLPEGLGRLLT